ncbi:MAG: sigma-70 family RNA polymerase sigma factor [Verrucomicrobiales bacterium]|nr:sigma-70 family RNA polymerase sigma factor [Verrucomicrobiales bacterium]
MSCCSTPSHASPAQPSPSGSPRPFATTRWTAVLQAGRGEDTAAHAALEELCRSYWPPLYAYVRRLGYSPPDAQDLTQGFFAQLLGRRTLARADPARGRFRSFLLASLKHFLAHEAEKARAQKRGGPAPPVSLDLDTAETRWRDGPAAPGDTPDRAFDRQWALALLERVLSRLRREYTAARRQPLFERLKDTLAGDRSERPYRALGEELGLSEGAVKIAAHRLRHRYRELLRDEVAQTVASPAEVEEELRSLFAALGP